MAANFPGPYEVRLRYACTPQSLPQREHSHRFNCDLSVVGDPGDPLSAFNIVTRQGTNPVLSTYLASYLALIAALYHTSTDFISWELWSYPAQSYDATFITGAAIGSAGLSAVNVNADQQTVISYRSTLGGAMFSHFMETNASVGARQGFPTAVTQINDLAAFVSNNDTGHRARDNGYPFIPLFYMPGQNEALFKDRLR